MAPVTDHPPQAVLVSHGMPSAPEPEDAGMKSLARAVGNLLPGWSIRGATLAFPGSLEAALDGLDRAIVYPFFMAEGVFTRQTLPARLSKSATRVRLLEPFGVHPGLTSLMAGEALQAAAAAGLVPEHTTLLLAAHGSKYSSTSKNSAIAMAERLSHFTPFMSVSVGFIEESPFLKDAAHDLGPAICLPFFARSAGHVEVDIPQALAEAGFSGLLLPAIGAHCAVPKLIADALWQTTQRAAA